MVWKVSWSSFFINMQKVWPRLVFLKLCRSQKCLTTNAKPYHWTYRWIRTRTDKVKSNIKPRVNLTEFHLCCVINTLKLGVLLLSGENIFTGPDEQWNSQVILFMDVLKYIMKIIYIILWTIYSKSNAASALHTDHMIKWNQSCEMYWLLWILISGIHMKKWQWSN